ncbi:hypothetical protein GCM10027404_12840 [Arthrobacter tumbae]
MISLSSNSTGVRVFSGTSNGASVTSVTIPAGSSTVSFYYGDTKAGIPTITTAGPGLSGATQTATITAAAPKRLIFGQQPTDAPKGVIIAPAITALVVDDFGNQTVSTAQVTISKTSNQGSVGGNVIENAINGVATFNISISGPSQQYTLELTSPGLTASPLSNPFRIS